MKRINKLIIKNFKFFYKKEELNFNNKNVLIYGENGSGKSSIYWALYTFLQSSMKDDNDIKKYFDKNNKKNLKNIHSLDEDAYIQVEIVDNEQIKKVFEISSETINTNKSDNHILKSNLTSDFINYKLLSKIYDFKHSQDIDLWNFFYNYVLDFMLYSDEFKTLKIFWDYLENGLEKINNRYPTINSERYKDFQAKIDNFNNKLTNLIIEITENANFILNNYFKEKIQIDFEYQKATYNDFIPNTKKRNHKTLSPKIILKVKFFDKDILNPQSFLNEAKLTSIALSIRFAILKNRLMSEDILKILVLDDLLISLDMSKRHEVLNFLINDTDLQNYQIIMLTHDKAFFEVAKRVFDYKQKDKWKYYEMYIDETGDFEKPMLIEHKSYFEKAKYYFAKCDYQACANYLRKEVEKTLKQILCKNINSEEYTSLQQMINQLKQNIPIKNSDTIIERAKRLSNNEDFINFDKNKLTDNNDKRIIGEVQTEIKKIRQLFEEKNHNTLKELLPLLEQFKDTILNPQSHDDMINPLYKKELENLIELIKIIR